MLTLVAGTGYLGRRVLDRLDDGIGLNRPEVDFDTVESLPVTVPQRYALLYTVPPGGAEPPAPGKDPRVWRDRSPPPAPGFRAEPGSRGYQEIAK